MIFRLTKPNGLKKPQYKMVIRSLQTLYSKDNALPMGLMQI